MALSNIFNEPRREITESFVGILAVGLFMWPIWVFASWFTATSNPPTVFVGMIVGIFIGILGVLVGGAMIFGVFIGTHALGDNICNWFQDRGIHLRPRTRYNRR